MPANSSDAHRSVAVIDGNSLIHRAFHAVGANTIVLQQF